MFVELLFTKVNNQEHFLQYGVDKERHVSKPRPAAKLIVKPGTEHSHYGIGVGALIDSGKSGEVEWLKDVLKKAIQERKKWEEETEFRRSVETEGQSVTGQSPPSISIDPGTDERKKALFKDGVLRFLMALIGCKKLDFDGLAFPNSF